MAELSEKQIKQRRNAAKKHGVHAFEARGEKTLEPKKVSRLAELRELVKNERGRQEAREELTARMLLINRQTGNIRGRVKKAAGFIQARR